MAGADELADLARASTATIATQLHKRGIRAVYLEGVRPLNPGKSKFVASAFTLRYIPAREDIDTPEVYADPAYPQRAAIEAIGPGQALVIDARSDTGAAVLGSILARRLRARGVAALVTDGAVRDVSGVLECGLAVFAAGAAAPLSIHRHHAADFQLPVSCGRVAIYPGDFLVGDDDGVICVPRALAAEIGPAAAEQEDLEAFIARRIAAGEPLRGNYPPSDELRAEHAALGENR